MIKKFSVDGMSCSACSIGIEKGIKKLDGVNSVNVSLLSKEMTVDFDEHILSEQLIIATVEKLGYSAITYGQKKQDRLSQAKKLKKRFFISLLILIPLVYLCMGAMINLPVPEKKLNFILQGVLALIAIIINRKFFIGGVKAIKNGLANMDTLVSLGSASAFIYSTIMLVLLLLGKQNPEHVFFDSSAMVVSLVTLGKWLEELSKVKTGDAVEKLGKLMPKTVVILRDNREVSILTQDLSVGDLLLLRAGDYCSVDGTITGGSASVDKSAITGESMPEELKDGDQISSGTILKDGYLIVRADKVGEQTLFNKIVQTVKTAGASKAPIQKFADKVAGVFVPVVCTLAIITFLVWILATNDLYKAFNFGISVLVISCPCALGLATPVAVMAGMGKGASQGVLFKDAQSLQNACRIDCVLLDKTATITVGKPKVIDYLSFSDEPDRDIFMKVSALESKSRHPLSECVLEYCGGSCLTVDQYEYVVGKGIIGDIYGITYYLGNKELIPKTVKIDVNEQDYDGKTLLYFADDDNLLAIFAVADYVKDDSVFAVKWLKERGIQPVMITGDNESSASRVAEQVGIDKYYAKVLPEQKYQVVEEFKKQNSVVAMVGDGINDSPALKSADVGIAIGTGTDIAIDSADVVLVGGNLTGLKNAIELSSKVLKIIKQNLFWAFFYNSIGIPIAGGALSFFGLILSPAIASLLMCCSSLFVVVNALRISVKNTDKEQKNKDEVLIEKKIEIDGMTCNHCVQKVKDALMRINGVKKVEVNLKEKTATFSCDEKVADSQIISAILNAGFIVK